MNYCSRETIAPLYKAGMGSVTSSFVSSPRYLSFVVHFDLGFRKVLKVLAKSKYRKNTTKIREQLAKGSMEYRSHRCFDSYYFMARHPFGVVEID